MANYLPFNSINHDRVYKAEDWAWYFSTFIGNGVFPKPTNGLMVVANGAMKVAVKAGFGFINGYAFRNQDDYVITIATGDGSLRRIDRVVLRWDRTNRRMVLDVLRGTPSADPQPVALTRTADTYELALADISVTKGMTTISQANITDRRTNTDLCGIVEGTVSQIDWATLVAQLDAFMADYKQQVSDDFEDWWDDLKDLLDPEPAGQLALAIQSLRAQIGGDLATLETEDKDSLIGAINEVLGVTGDNASAITVLQTLTKMLSATGASRANSFIYEYNLGASFTNEQSADIRAGRFDKVRPGGYWTINGHKYWAAHADYRLHCGDTELTKHHMLVFPDKSFYNRVMNSTSVTTGAYYGSNMVSDGLTQALATVKSDFGESHVLTYRTLLANAVSNGASTGWSWYSRQIDLMNECMVYGHQAWGAAAHNGYDVGCDKTQIALFQARPDLIVNRENWWLRDVRSVSNFCCVLTGGSADHGTASSVFGVRPAFLIA